MKKNNVLKKDFVYNGINFKNEIESNFAMYLDGKFFRCGGESYYRKPIRWEYKTKQFELFKQEIWLDKTQTNKSRKRIKQNKKYVLERQIYTPSFYLPDFNLNIEIKDLEINENLFKINFRLFKHKYPNEAIWLVTSEKDFKNLDEVLESLKISKEN